LEIQAGNHNNNNGRLVRHNNYNAQAKWKKKSTLETELNLSLTIINEDGTADEISTEQMLVVDGRTKNVKQGRLKRRNAGRGVNEDIANVDTGNCGT